MYKQGLHKGFHKHQSLGLFLNRFYSILLIFAAITMLMVGRVSPTTIEQLRGKINESFVPVISILSEPLSMGHKISASLDNVFNLYDQNKYLTEEKTRLEEWYHTALKLEAENKELKKLLNFKDAPAYSFITARVVADFNEAFMHSILITAGLNDGIKKGQGVIVDNNLVGRIVEVGPKTARVLLVTDLSSRIPVIL